MIMLPAMSFMLKSPQMHGISDSQYGLVFVPGIVTAIVVTFKFRDYLENNSHARLFVWGVLSNIAFLFFLYISSFTLQSTSLSFALLLSGNFFYGIGFGLLLTALNVATIEYFPNRRGALVVGLHASLGIGASLSPLLVSNLYELNHWEWAPVTLSLLFSVLIILEKQLDLFCGMDDKPTTKSEKIVKFELGLIKGLPNGAKIFLLCIVGYGFIESTIGNWTASYLTSEKYFSTAVASACLSVFWLFITVGRVIGSVLVLKLNPFFLYIVSPTISMMAIYLIIQCSEESRIVSYYALAGIGCSYFFPLSISLLTKYHDERREELSAYSVSAIMAGVCLGSPFIGFLRSFQILDFEAIFSILLIVGFALVLNAGVLARIFSLQKNTS